MVVARQYRYVSLLEITAPRDCGSVPSNFVFFADELANAVSFTFRSGLTLSRLRLDVQAERNLCTKWTKEQR